MAQFLLFVYFFIITVSLFLVEAREPSMSFFTLFSIFLILSYAPYLSHFSNIFSSYLTM